MTFCHHRILARSFPALVFVLLMTMQASAITRYVSMSGSGTPPYTNWAMAAEELMHAVVFSAAGDVIEVREKSRKVQKVVDAQANLERSPLPNWIEIDKDKFTGKITQLPARAAIAADIDEQLIVELYSK